MIFRKIKAAWQDAGRLTQTWGPHHPSVAVVLNSLIALYEAQGRSSLAELYRMRAADAAGAKVKGRSTPVVLPQRHK